ncbi:sugar kinase [Solibacillus sp. R5-41]|uniref:ROK family transcriptional regulator n=1 Tax=Solibacillus sp. R5-41 TaxID=2048654 RepID=UPI000C124607|nr:ROK family transcriptional regulator [Solibacillus sp. R5-41]ATP40419.1 sugar kinase [Solibacillus sp. R5-41]
MRLGTFEWMKSVNRSIIINKIRTDAPISRAQIAKETKITPPTVSSNVKELIALGIVEETDYGTSSGGRKPKMLMLTENKYFVIGVDAGSQKIQASLSNLKGEILNRYHCSLEGVHTNELFIEALMTSIDTISSFLKPSQDILGIGIAMHGVVDPLKGEATFAPNLGLTNIPIKEMLYEHFQVPIYVENDARAMAMGEAWFDTTNVPQSLVTLNIGRGVGAGIIVDGKLFYGKDYLAGEIGHMTINMNGDICDCGNRGCLQTLTSGKTIASKAKERIPSTHFERFNDQITGDTVFQLACQGNEEAIKIFHEIGHAIGIGLINLIHMFNPERIVLGGGVMDASQYILPIVKQIIQEKGLTGKAKNSHVEISRWGHDATLKGAIAIVLSHVFDDVAEDELSNE